MNKEIWQSLISLENQEYVKSVYHKSFNKSLNSRRAKEINSSAKQAREYFRNANNSTFSVRPLLVFYGVTCLSRSLTLLMTKNGGEESLTAGHGLTTDNWSTELSGNLSSALKNIGNLKVKTTSGLFTDFINGTENIMNFHVRSSGVDWFINYPIPPQGKIVSFSQLLCRLPDLHQDFKNLGKKIQYSTVNEMTYSDKGFTCKVRKNDFDLFSDWFLNNGYEVTDVGDWTTIKCSAENFIEKNPQFIHSYVQKSFGSIPSLYISKPFDNDSRYSQLGITFLASYFLGMMVRYYPTQWTELINGGAGDNYWPIINRLQNYVEQTFPELIVELIFELNNRS